MIKNNDKPTILIVDDNFYNIELLILVLNIGDYRLEYTKSGIDAISILSEKKVDLILLDIIMPEIDGFEICRRIKSKKKLAHIPIIFITGLADVKDKVRAFDVGGVDYITKPFLKEEVISRVNAHLTIVNYQSKIQKALSTAKKNEVLLNEYQKVANLGSYVFDISNGSWTSTAILDNIFGINNTYRRDISTWMNIVHKEDKQVLKDYFENNIFKNKESLNVEYRIIRQSDKQERWVHSIAKPVINKQGEVVKLIGTITDITEKVNVLKSLSIQKGLFETV